MPELPDITTYRDAIARKAVGTSLLSVTVLNPFLLRTVTPRIEDLHRRRLADVNMLGKRIVLALEGDFFAVIHLMVAGRLRWLEQRPKAPAKIALALFEFERGTLVLTEAGSKRRASLHLVASRSDLAALDPGGVDMCALSADTFTMLLQRENHTLKRVLTDPHIFVGIGNGYSDEILHRARLSPIALSQKLTRAECAGLHQAAIAVLTEWTDRLRREAGDFPNHVTAFRPEMAVHGKFGQPCPTCHAPVQRIVYAENECNYCARCQTGGKLLADRSLSRLLKSSWPRSIDELG